VFTQNLPLVPVAADAPGCVVDPVLAAGAAVTAEVVAALVAATLATGAVLVRGAAEPDDAAGVELPQPPMSRAISVSVRIGTTRTAAIGFPLVVGRR